MRRQLLGGRPGAGADAGGRGLWIAGVLGADRDGDGPAPELGAQVIDAHRIGAEAKVSGETGQFDRCTLDGNPGRSRPRQASGDLECSDPFQWNREGQSVLRLALDLQ